jgi:hypothetical protein
MITIDWGNTYIINVPQSYLTLVQGTLYSMDTNQFRLDLKDLEDSPSGMSHPKTHLHNTEVGPIVGVTYARVIQIIPPYSVQFEDGAYSVTLTGSNNNIFDIQGGILVQNQVQVIPNNSAGLVVTGGSGSSVWSESEKDLILSDVDFIKNKLPSDGNNIASDQQVSDTTGAWTEAEKDQLIVDLETTKRQATKAVNNTESSS